jgi:hypothetical protein
VGGKTESCLGDSSRAPISSPQISLCKLPSPGGRAAPFRAGLIVLGEPPDTSGAEGVGTTHIARGRRAHLPRVRSLTRSYPEACRFAYRLIRNHVPSAVRTPSTVWHARILARPPQADLERAGGCSCLSTESFSAHTSCTCSPSGSAGFAVCFRVLRQRSNVLRTFGGSCHSIAVKVCKSCKSLCKEARPQHREGVPSCIAGLPSTTIDLGLL